MKIILNVELPKGWSKETGPDGTIYYFKIDSKNPDLYTTQHPLVFFFRKTFNKVVKACMESNKQEIVKNMIIDEISQQEIEKFIKMKF
jgi:hypothetical protein